MYDELTAGDVRQIEEELTYRRTVLRPKLLDEVKVARAFGDLSENFEYKSAKKEKNHNDSRIRYLERMLKTGRVIAEESSIDTVGLYDKVSCFLEDEEEESVLRVVTTVRADPLNGLIGKDSPLGKALLGAKLGDKVTVQVNDSYSYDVEILGIEKAEDDGTIPISKY